MNVKQYVHPARKRLERAADSTLRGCATAVSTVLTRFDHGDRILRADVAPRGAKTGFIAATAHWSAPNRLPFLAEFVRGLDRQNEPFAAAIHVNGPRSVEEFADDLRCELDGNADVTVRVVADAQLIDALLPVDRSILLVDCRHLRGNPYRLTWQHKTLFHALTFEHNIFDKIGALHYSEDDMALSEGALEYWRAYRSRWRTSG